MNDTKTKSNRLPWILSVAFVFLFILAVPWYWDEEGAKPVFGMPLWALVSLGVSFIISCLTAWAAFRTWPNDSDDLGGNF